MTEIRIASASRARAGKARHSRPSRRPAPTLSRDDGLFQIGLDDDAAGPFPSRPFAAAVAARTRRGQNAVPTT